LCLTHLVLNQFIQEFFFFVERLQPMRNILVQFGSLVFPKIFFCMKHAFNFCIVCVIFINSWTVKIVLSDLFFGFIITFLWIIFSAYVGIFFVLFLSNFSFHRRLVPFDIYGIVWFYLKLIYLFFLVSLQNVIWS
jgi:hypothetical protein